jgi:bacterial/archaeal transporter family-2 protein
MADGPASRRPVVHPLAHNPRCEGGDPINLTPGVLAAAAATLALGAIVALQPPINSELGRRTSDLGAAFVSVTLTFMILLVVFLVFGDWGSLSKLKEVPAIYLSGGIYGALFVVVSLITVRYLGAGLTIALLIAGQLIVAALLDHYGVLGLDQIELSAARVAGIAALLAGVVLMTLDL